MLKSEGGGRFFEAPHHPLKPTRSFFFIHEKNISLGGDDFFTPQILQKCHRIKHQHEWQRK